MIVVHHDLLVVMVKVEGDPLPSFHLVVLCRGCPARSTEIGIVCETSEVHSRSHLHESYLKSDLCINHNVELL